MWIQFIFTLNILKKLQQIKLHQIIFGIILVILVSIIKYIFSVDLSDLPDNILIGTFCLFFRLFFIDSLADYFNQLGINFSIGQFL